MPPLPPIISTLWVWLNHHTFLGNPATDWLGALLTFILALLLLRLVTAFIVSRLRRLTDRTQYTVDTFIVELLERLHPLVLLAMAASTAPWWLHMKASLERFFEALPILAILLQLGLWAGPLTQFLLNHYIGRRNDDRQKAVLQTMEGPAQFIGVFVIWALAILMALQNMGINVTTLVAGLGIGGIAIALAVQTILGDLFAAFSIVVDKPFVVGDFIVTDKVAGTIRHIGLKTTRIAALSGELLLVSNSDLLSSRIQNFAPLEERRIVFTFGVTYQTPPEKAAQLGQWVKAIVDSQTEVRFDRAHFFKFGESSLDVEVVYFVLSPDYTVYMDRQQAINVALMEKLAAEGVEFSFPARSLVVEQRQPFELAPPITDNAT